MEELAEHNSDIREWSAWHRFPDPRRQGILVAPFGPGCYELRDGGQLVLYGRGKNTALRMTSLLPSGLGSGTRNNKKKREHVLKNIATVEYRTLACLSNEEAKKEERKLRTDKDDYLFPA